MSRYLRSRSRLGKYRIERRIAEGGFAAVYAAVDTIEGVHVALKVPFSELVDDATLRDFRREVRLMSRLDHPNILPLKSADFIDGRLVIAYPLGQGTLSDWLARRRSLARVLDYAGQLLEGVAYAHEHRVVHCDIKPDNVILFDDGRLRLSDFGVAKVALKTLQTTGSGTLGYLAPEHALGRPTFRSDVFSLGLVLYQMLSGHVPKWPFRWPPERFEVVRRKVSTDFLVFLGRALRVDETKRFSDAVEMREAFRELERKGRLLGRRRHRRRAVRPRGRR